METDFSSKGAMVGIVSRDTVGCTRQLCRCESGYAERRSITNEDVMDHRTGAYPYPQKMLQEFLERTGFRTLFNGEIETRERPRLTLVGDGGTVEMLLLRASFYFKTGKRRSKK